MQATNDDLLAELQIANQHLAAIRSSELQMSAIQAQGVESLLNTQYQTEQMYQFQNFGYMLACIIIGYLIMKAGLKRSNSIWGGRNIHG